MKKIIKCLFIALFFTGFISCNEELDFNQFDDLEATPTYEGSIFYLESPEIIINQFTGFNIFTQNYNFDAFSSDIFANRVIDGTITYVFENTTSKDLKFTIEFLDEDGNITDTKVFLSQKAPAPTSQYEFTYGDLGESIDIIKTLTDIRVTAENLGDNTTVSDLEDPLIILKSSGKFRVRLK